MRIQLLGTAAAEGWPAVFCGCRTCNRARAAKGKNIRTRQSAQIDDVIKIDLPPDTHYHQFHFGIRLSELKHLFITHSHDDHFAVAELHYIRPPFAYNQSSVPIKIYGNPTVIKAVDSIKTREELPIETITLRPFDPVRADHLKFTPIPARHKPDEQCFTYVAQSDTSAVLFAWDTGLYDKQSMEYLLGYRFDVIIIECTQGTLQMPSRMHMGFEGVLEIRDTLAKSGGCDSHTRVVLTHFSHNIGLLHDEFAEIAEREGVEVAWDGMIIDT
ncbi:MAG: MBL fold metallo-hydrolase [Armatimonadetes bacterium]|nr:MBL fold metallo-hydrolase [Armatimonadota bacterium]